MLAERSFDDYKVGDRVTTRARTVTEADLVGFAGLTWDFHPLHTDEEYARTTRFGRRIAHGPLVYAMAVGMMPIAFFGDALVAFLGVSELNHLAPVYPGDTLHVEAEVTQCVPGRTGGGVVIVEYTVLSHPGTVVLTADMKFLMRAPTAPVANPVAKENSMTDDPIFSAEEAT